MLAALYPAVVLGQLVTVAVPDRVGRKWLMPAGMWTHALAIALVASVTSFWPWAFRALLLGAGTAIVYPALLAALGDVAHPSAGEPPPSACTGCRGTAASPSGRCSPE